MTFEDQIREIIEELFDEKIGPLLDRLEPRSLLTAEELATKWKIPLDSVYEISKKRLPVVKIGNRNRYRMIDVKNYEAKKPPIDYTAKQSPISIKPFPSKKRRVIG